MRTAVEIISEVVGIDQSEMSLNDPLNFHLCLGDAIESMEQYAADKQARIDELEYKLSFLLSNIKLCKNKFDEEILVANTQLKKDVFGDMSKLLDIVSTIPEVTATVTASAQ